MVKLTALLKRKPRVAKEEFAKRWRDEPTKLSSPVARLEYRSNVATNYQPDVEGVEAL